MFDLLSTSSDISAATVGNLLGNSTVEWPLYAYPGPFMYPAPKATSIAATYCVVKRRRSTNSYKTSYSLASESLSPSWRVVRLADEVAWVVKFAAANES